MKLRKLSEAVEDMSNQPEGGEESDREYQPGIDTPSHSSMKKRSRLEPKQFMYPKDDMPDR